MRVIEDLARGLALLAATLFGFIGLGLLFAIAGIAALGLATLQQPLGQVWFQHDPFILWLKSPSIQLVQVFFERKLQMPFLWDPAVLTLLNWPAWAALLFAAAIALVIAALLVKLARLNARPKRAV